MERPAYERDAYLRELDNEVVEVGTDGDRPWAVTADSIFYPEGGGQPADRGRMGGVEVVDVRKVDGAIRHLPRGARFEHSDIQQRAIQEVPLYEPGTLP